MNQQQWQFPISHWNSFHSTWFDSRWIWFLVQRFFNTLFNKHEYAHFYASYEGVLCACARDSFIDSVRKRPEIICCINKGVLTNLMIVNTTKSDSHLFFNTTTVFTMKWLQYTHNARKRSSTQHNLWTKENYWLNWTTASTVTDRAGGRARARAINDNLSKISSVHSNGLESRLLPHLMCALCALHHLIGRLVHSHLARAFCAIVQTPRSHRFKQTPERKKISKLNQQLMATAAAAAPPKTVYATQIAASHHNTYSHKICCFSRHEENNQIIEIYCTYYSKTVYLVSMR